MARSDVNIVSQYGVQSAFGAPATASTRISSDGITFDAEWNEQFYRQTGNKFATVGVRHRQWARGVREGLLDYNHYPTILASMFGHGTITSPVLGSYAYPIAPNSQSENSSKVLTYQSGDATAAREINDVQHTGLSVTLEENGISFTSPFIGGVVDNGATLDTVTRNLVQQPVSIADVDWFLDPTYAGIGTTKVTDVVSGGFEIPEVVIAKFVQNRTFPGIAALVEQATEEATVSFVTEYNAQARALYDSFNVDVKPMRYLQLLMTGDLILTATTYLIKHNFAVMPMKPMERRAPSGGIYGFEFPFRIVHDTTMGRALEVTIVNTTPTV